MSRPTVSVVIPTIPPREKKLKRALDSVYAQTFPVDEIITPVDTKREGAAVNRQRGLDAVTSDFFLPLDDDDVLYPFAIEHMLDFLLAQDADMCYGWYDVVGGTDPRPEVFGKEFDPANPVQTTIVVLAKTEVAKACGYVDHGDLATLTHVDRHYHGEDALYIRRAVDLGAKIVHLPERVFEWHHWGGNTSGLPKW